MHGPYEDSCLNDDRRSVIRLPSDTNLHQLLTLGDLAESMAPVTTQRIKSLSRDTSLNLAHTCYGLVDLAKYLLNHEFDYVPFGHFTTNPLEKEFSKLRQGSGGAYFISVQQALSKVEIHKTKLCLVQNVDIFHAENVVSGHSCSVCTFKPDERLCDIIDNLPRLESEIAVDVKMALVYVAGYVHRNEGCLDDTHNIYSQYGSYFDS